MKKVFTLGLVLTIVCSMMFVNVVLASPADKQSIKAAIQKYKSKNYIGCISDLRLVTAQDPSSAIAWYYLGNAYMKIAMKPEAHEAFDKVVSLNTVPQLTSYSIQAKLCMENPAKCSYQNFTAEQIDKLKEDPVTFLDGFFAQQEAPSDPETAEIEKLIDGKYNKIHPQAQDFINQERIKMEQNQINNTSALMNDEKMAQVVEMLQTQRNDLSQMAMLLNTDKKENNNNYADMMNYLQNSENKSVSPEMIQLMMMQNSMTNF